MKRLLIKLGCFFAILLLIKLSFVFLYGDKFIYRDAGAKGNYYELEYRKSELAKEDYDTVFIGSSRTALGISPTYFDSLTKKTKSYNFGIMAGLPPKTFDWCEELIESKTSLKYVFFELSGADDEGGEARNSRLLTFFKPSVPREEFEQVYYEFKIPLQNILLEDFLAKQNLPLSEVFLAETVQAEFSRNLQIEKGNFAKKLPLDEDYWSRVSRLAKLAEAKYVRLYFFIPPRIKTDRELEQIYPVYQKLPAENNLRAAHFDESLYNIENSLDNTHLNYRGAKKFTELLAEAFDKQSR